MRFGCCNTAFLHDVALYIGRGLKQTTVKLKNIPPPGVTKMRTLENGKVRIYIRDSNTVRTYASKDGKAEVMDTHEFPTVSEAKEFMALA